MSAADRIDRKIHNARMRLDDAAMCLSEQMGMGGGPHLAAIWEEVENAVLGLGALLRRRKQRGKP